MGSVAPARLVHLLLALFAGSGASSFIAPSSLSAQRRETVFSHPVLKGRSRTRGPCMLAALPRTTGEMVGALRTSVQAALQARKSRIRVDMPPGFDFGVEGQSKRSEGGVAEIVRSDRQLARLFLGMFEGTGLVPLIVFSSSEQLKAAKKIWGATEAKVALLAGEAAESTPGKKKLMSKSKRKPSGGGGFGAPSSSAAGEAPKAMASVPASTEVLFVVAPGGAQLLAVQAFCQSQGSDRLVVLLNARCIEQEDKVDDDQRAFFDDEFETVVAFDTNPARLRSGDDEIPKDPIVLWRGFPAEWVLARKPKLGPPSVLLKSDEKPALADIRKAVDQAQQARDGGVLDAVTSLFKGSLSA
mmetsp:Transcript_23371/g.51102  ORF Transcript_23371/g.51102 Transcript_23371/m.51102 type:complete len:357 (+) Transcript_23371:3-1073(+)